MAKNLKALLAAAAVALVLVAGAISQTTPTPKHHVVFQLSEKQGEDWDALIRHVNNTRNALDKDGGIQVEVVFFGPGINMLNKTSTAYEERLKKLADTGVKLSACQNAMKAYKLKSEDLFPFAGEVDSGIAQITRRQEAGWAYIH